MKKTIAILLITLMPCTILAGCSRQSEVVSRNISKEADNFNVVRRLTVINAKTDSGLTKEINSILLQHRTSTGY